MTALPRLGARGPVVLLAAWVLSTTGCGDSSVPDIEPYEPDAGRECEPAGLPSDRDGGTSDTDAGAAGDTDGGGSSDLDAGTGGRGGGGEMDAAASALPGCADDEICLQDYRCYPRCESDSDCSVNEMCGEMGACVGRTEPRPRDSGPTDPCEEFDCSEDPGGDVCRIVDGEPICVECNTRSDCALQPVCDVARGKCVPFQDEPCAPCNLADHCPSGECVTLEGSGEQVCLVSPAGDAGTCPAGLAPDAEDEYCLPPLGTCTGFFAAVRRRSCEADDDCVPFEAPDVADGTCDMTSTDAGTTSRCLQPCDPTEPNCPPGQTCDTSVPGQEFCH